MRSVCYRPLLPYLCFLLELLYLDLQMLLVNISQELFDKDPLNDNYFEELLPLLLILSSLSFNNEESLPSDFIFLEPDFGYIYSKFKESISYYFRSSVVDVLVFKYVLWDFCCFKSKLLSNTGLDIS